VVYVPDASRSVGVCSELLSDERATKFINEMNADYRRVRELHANKKTTPLVSLAAARANKTPIDWSTYTPPAPSFIGRRLFRNYDLAELAACIDWGPFFQTWDLAGPFPEILRTVDDDVIEVYRDASRSEVALRWQPLRIQTERPVIDGVPRPNRSLADFIAPKGARDDYIGLFAVTAGLGVEKKEKLFLDDHDDYSAIMLKALADRLAEAFAERLHQRVRTELWGYAPDEKLSHEELIGEKYRGIRPAPGYPACPEHSIKRGMFELLGAGEIGMGLTESLAMTPAASVSGFYLAHPQAAYFNVGKIGDDQLADWAQRQQLALDAARRLLSPSLS
jgi:5-methyltetrahydrofolate--homocysteine methyltransferase